MKRRMFSLLLGFALVFSLALTAFANDCLPRVIDEADLLTFEEEQALEELAEDFRIETNVDAVVLTVNSLNGQPIVSFADDYYDHNGYGIGTEYSGVILVVSMAERELYISTCGDVIRKLSDNELDNIIDSVSYWLSNGAYYDAFETYFGMVPLYLETGSDHGHEVAYTKPGVNWLLSLLIGAVTAGVAVLVMSGTMNTKRQQRSAEDYMKRSSFDLRNRQDIFLYSNVTKTKIQQNNGGGGRTSSCRSSSGRSHGGRGGRF